MCENVSTVSRKNHGYRKAKEDLRQFSFRRSALSTYGIG